MSILKTTSLLVNIDNYRALLETFDGSYQQKYLMKYSSYEKHITQFLTWVMRNSKETIFFDVGANIGYYSVMASVVAGRTARVVAFEPASETRAVLERNIIQNNCINVNIEPIVVAGDERQVRLVQPDGFGEGAYALTSEDTAQTILSTTIDSYCVLNNIWPSIIKIDAEGLDVDILKGTLNTLGRRSPIVVFEFQPAKIAAISPISLKDVFINLKDIGYIPFFFRGHANYAVELLNFSILEEIYELWVAENNAAHLDILLWPPQLPRLFKQFEMPK